MLLETTGKVKQYNLLKVRSETNFLLKSFLFQKSGSTPFIQTFVSKEIKKKYIIISL